MTHLDNLPDILTATGLRGCALAGVVSLLVVPDTPASFAVWGVLITSVAGLIQQFLSARASIQKAEQERRFAIEDRLMSNADRKEANADRKEASAARKEATAARADLMQEIRANTALTAQANAAAEHASAAAAAALESATAAAMKDS